MAVSEERMAEIREQEAERERQFDAGVATGIGGVAVTHGQLKAVFMLVSNKEHWKARINAKVTRADLVQAAPQVNVERHQDLIVEAVAYFVGGCEWPVPTLVEGMPGYQVRSKGYWHYIGA